MEKNVSDAVMNRFHILHLARMKSGRCAVSVEGWADVEGEPRKVRIDLEFHVRTVRARVRPAHVPMPDAADRDCPCEWIDIAGPAAVAEGCGNCEECPEAC
jgi:hypothetical protein